jgi:hypothetical protein
MNIMSQEEFIAFYKKYDRFPRGSYTGKRPINDRELKTRYDRYVRAESRSATYREEKEHPDEVMPEGPRRCSLLVLLDDVDARELKANAGQLLYTLDRAHIFGKAAHSNLRYNVDDVCWLNRWSHSCLDNQKNPINGKSISREDVIEWWKLIVGEERYARLSVLAREQR